MPGDVVKTLPVFIATICAIGITAALALDGSEQSRNYDPHGVAFNGLRYDERFATFLRGDAVLRRFASLSAEKPFWLELRREGKRVVWIVRATSARSPYTQGGKFSAPITIAVFDAVSAKLISTRKAVMKPLRIQPNSTMPAGNGPVTPCPMSQHPSPRPGYAYTTAPPNAVPGQNYNCLRPIGGLYRVHRPRANVTSALGSLRSLSFAFESIAARLPPFPQYIVELKLVPFGAAAKEDLGGITTYDTEAMHLVFVAKVIAPQGVGARYCRPPRYAIGVFLYDSQTLAPAGGGTTTFCKAVAPPARACPPPDAGPRPYLVLYDPLAGARGVPVTTERVVLAGSTRGLRGDATVTLSPGPRLERMALPSGLPSSYNVKGASAQGAPENLFVVFRLPKLQPSTTYSVDYSYQDSGATPPSCSERVERTAGSFST